MGPDFTLTYYSTDIFSPFESRHAFFFFKFADENPHITFGGQVRTR